MPLEGSHFYGFGPYRIDTVERRLLRGNEQIPLTPKAYERFWPWWKTQDTGWIRMS